MGAANPPPVAPPPRGLLSSLPIQTAAANWGTYPTNQTSRSEEVVPVLPAAGRPIWAAVPVPPLITPCNTLLREAAAQESSTSWVWVCCLATHCRHYQLPELLPLAQNTNHYWQRWHSLPPFPKVLRQSPPEARMSQVPSDS
jgi:hypothetical protein